MSSPDPSAELLAHLGAGRGLSLEDRLVLAHYHGTRDGACAAFTATFAAEFRRFLEDWFDCQTAEEAAAFFSVSERTIQQLWQDAVIPKDTALGPKLPRTSLRALKELLAASRIKSRTQTKTPLRVVTPRAA